MNAWPLVSIIIVNWNGLADTLECLDSLSKASYPNFRVLVVDNGSRNHEAQAIREAYPPGGQLAVEVIEAGRNLGFTGGNNFGFKHALSGNCDYLLCLNNDTIVDSRFLEPLVKALEEHPNHGIATGSIYFYDEPERLSTLGCGADLSELPAVWHLNDPGCLVFDESCCAEVATVDGCCLLLSRDLMVKIKGFDNRFFAYNEDADLCLRAKKNGYRCLAVPASHVWHKVSSSSGGENSSTAVHYSLRNNYRLVMLHGLPEEKTSYKHQYREYWLHQWEALVQDGAKDLSVWQDQTRVRGVRDAMVNTGIGWFGCSGSRQHYHIIECTLRLFVTLRMKLTAIQCRCFFPIWTKLYWKLYTKSPAIVARLPKPILSRIENQQQRKDVGEVLMQRAKLARRNLRLYEIRH
jgi:GT2 family glycosyltransferase